MSARFLIILAAVALLLSGSGTAFGQAVYGSISGTITDPTGAAIPNARLPSPGRAGTVSASDVRGCAQEREPHRRRHPATLHAAVAPGSGPR